MEEKKCKNCKFYIPPKDAFDKKRGSGGCECDKFMYEGFGVPKSAYPLDDKLVYWDYESYHAGFNVGENFGCIHYRPNK